MIEIINNLLIGYGINESIAVYLSYIIAVIFIVLASIVVDIISKKVLLKLLKVSISRSKTKWDDVLIEKKVFERIARIPSVLVIHLFAPVFPDFQSWIQRIVFAYIIFNIMVSLSRALDAVDKIYRNYEVSKERPIKGYLQVVKIFISIMATVIIISILIDRSPWLLLSGIGAATAVLLLIFQNSILGLVASIQLATNDMLQIGDWIEMPSHGADGDVIDISLHTVKVQNWDKTIITIPTYALISNSFKNWRGMHSSGGRRIKRSVYVDMTSIKFCDDEMLERFKGIQYIKEYIDKKLEDIDKYNKEHSIDSTNIVNGRHLTNIGTFRIYIENYIKNHPRINESMTQMVRQLQPTENGLPIEIYAFTKGTVWAEYEAVQSDIFDHILAIVPVFGLRLYQGPTGFDLRQTRSNDLS
ncbi:MAG: mechanosensitive ion channel domain-containing protein [Tissierellales bacterium]